VKLLVVSSVGGHLEEVRHIVSSLNEFDVVWVVNDELKDSRDLPGRTYRIAHAERDWRVALNVWEAWKIIRTERPDAMLSAGAGPAVPMAAICRIRRIPVVFVECITQVDSPSLTGRLMYHLANRFFYQWPELSGTFPRGECVGLLR
jgi:beta-1,4-N-acetylglucosaminyltransferase